MSDLDAAVAAARRQDFGAARDALILAWRARRSPVLAELIDVFDARAPDATSAQIAAIVTPRAASSLTNLRALDDLDDPRLAGWAIEALARPPFTAVGANAFLVAIARTAVRHRDPRLASRTGEIRAALTTRIGRLAIRNELLAIVERGLVEPVAADVARENVLLAIAEPMRATGRSADALLAAIHANPDDDAARLVYADLLSEQGDPRGEFIALQLGDANPQRQAELLKLHGKQWLGDLAPVLSWGKGYAKTTFRRGFVSNADIILSVGKKLRPILVHPSWATVETFTGFYRDDDGLLARAPLRALRSLDLDAAKVAHLLQRADKLTTVTRIKLSYPLPTRDDLHAALPHLVELTGHWQQPDAAVLAAQAAWGIPQLVMFGGGEDRPRMKRFAARLVGTSAPLERLTLHVGWEHEVGRPAPLVLVRGPDGNYGACQPASSFGSR